MGMFSWQCSSLRELPTMKRTHQTVMSDGIQISHTCCRTKLDLKFVALTSNVHMCCRRQILVVIRGVVLESSNSFSDSLAGPTTSGRVVFQFAPGATKLTDAQVRSWSVAACNRITISV